MSMDTPTLNTDQLLSITDSDIEFIEELWECFQEEYIESFSTLKQACEENDKSKAILNAHNIKSGSANIGAEKLRELSANLESNVKEELFSNILSNLSNLQDEYNILSETFEKWLETIQ